MNEARRKKYLRKYVDSNGSEVPVDYQDYIPGGAKEKECVFCEDWHMNNKVFTWDPIEGKVARDLQIHSCDQCDMHVQVMLKQSFGREVEFDQEPLNFGQGYNARTIHFGEEDRLNDIINNLRFVDDAFQYYVHLNSNKDIYIQNDENNSCYVCGNRERGHPTMAYATWATIDVPVKRDNQLNGGKVFLCPKHEAAIENEFINVRGIEHLYTHFLILEKIKKAVCTNCEATYYLTAEEAKSRNTDAQYVCPECALEAIDNTVDSDWLYSEKSKPARSYPPDRHLEQVCDTCGSCFFVDLMIDYKWLSNYHLSGKKILCNTCIINGVKDFLEHLLVYNHHDNVYIKMIFNKYGWEYDIIRISRTSSSLEYLHKCKTDETDIAEAVAVAYHEVTLLFHGVQKELW